MPVTIKEIAQRLGLDPSTVSRALSDSSQVSAATRARVQRVARELNYTPNLLARNLVQAATNMIGCLVLEYSNPFFVPMVRAIEDAAGAQDYIVILGESRRQLDGEINLVERFRRVRVAGVIAMPVLVELDHLRVLETEGAPVVLVGRMALDFDSVNVDNERGGYLVGQHLLRLGHSHIGVILSGDPGNQPEQARLRGLQTALREAGIDPTVALRMWEAGNMRLAGGEQAAEGWLNEVDRPTAVFGSNDLLAMGFIHRARQAGVTLPDDVAVVGFDDIPFADLFSVPLSTVAFPKDEVGRMAAELLLGRLDDDGGTDRPQHIALEPQLIVRASCGGNHGP